MLSGVRYAIAMWLKKNHAAEESLQLKIITATSRLCGNTLPDSRVGFSFVTAL